MASTQPHVRVAVAAFIVRPDRRFLVGRRIGSHAAGTWQIAGGHLEWGESFETCAIREVLEETGLQLSPAPENNGFITAINYVMKDEQKHYVTIFMHLLAPADAAPQNMEPHKCEGWSWWTLEDLLAVPDETLIGSLRDLRLHQRQTLDRILI